MSLFDMLNDKYYLVFPDGKPAEIDHDSWSVIFRATKINEITFFSSHSAAKRIVDNYTTRGGYPLRILRIRIARSEEGMPFLYSEVPGDDQSAPPAIGVKIRPAEPFSTWDDLSHLHKGE